MSLATGTRNDAGIGVLEARGDASYRAPRVNLLPPEIHEREVLRRLKAGAAAAVVTVAAAVGAGWYGAHQQVATARDGLAQAQQQTAVLQARLARLAGVRATFAEVETARALLGQALGAEIQWSRYLTDLSLTVPSQVWLTSFNAQENPAATGTPTAASGPAAAILPGVAGPGTYGTVTISGVALHRDDVATWLETLARERGYAAPFASTITESTIGGTVVYRFTSTVTLTPAALWGRAGTLLGN